MIKKKKYILITLFIIFCLLSFCFIIYIYILFEDPFTERFPYPKYFRKISIKENLLSDNPLTVSSILVPLINEPKYLKDFKEEEIIRILLDILDKEYLNENYFCEDFENIPSKIFVILKDYKSEIINNKLKDIYYNKYYFFNKETFTSAEYIDNFENYNNKEDIDFLLNLLKKEDVEKPVFHIRSILIVLSKIAPEKINKDKYLDYFTRYYIEDQDFQIEKIGCNVITDLNAIIKIDRKLSKKIIERFLTQNISEHYLYLVKKIIKKNNLYSFMNILINKINNDNNDVSLKKELYLEIKKIINIPVEFNENDLKKTHENMLKWWEKNSVNFIDPEK